MNKLKKECASTVFSALVHLGIPYQNLYCTLKEALQSIDSSLYYSQNTFCYKEIIIHRIIINMIHITSRTFLDFQLVHHILGLRVIIAD